MTMPSRHPDLLVEICRRLYGCGFVAATDGNVSIRLPGGNILTTRSAVNKGMVTRADLVEVTPRGERVRRPRSARSAKNVSPSSELGMHLFIYRSRPDVNAVVHAHPPFATAFAVAGLSIPADVFPEVVIGLGRIPLAAYATPATREVAASLAPFVRSADAILMANHGVVTCGSDLWDAYFKMEKVEHAAHVTVIARTLGGEKHLNKAQLKKLRSK
jgi:L-fuculose-phosphate aldolase